MQCHYFCSKKRVLDLVLQGSLQNKDLVATWVWGLSRRSLILAASHLPYYMWNIVDQDSAALCNIAKSNIRNVLGVETLTGGVWPKIGTSVPWFRWLKANGLLFCEANWQNLMFSSLYELLCQVRVPRPHHKMFQVYWCWGENTCTSDQWCTYMANGGRVFCWWMLDSIVVLQSTLGVPNLWHYIWVDLVVMTRWQRWVGSLAKLGRRRR